MLYFATYFDINYLNRGIVLFESLAKQCSSSFTLFILALDDKVVDYFKQHPNERIKVISLNDIEQHFGELKEIKKTRNLIEYYFTLSPFLPLYIFDLFPEVNRITTLDADILFFSDPTLIFKSYPDASILITPHNFSEGIKKLERYGIYNVSFQSFKNNVCARTCLEDWKIKCSEWCFDYFDEKNSRFADQKYLDDWKEKFNNVEVIQLPGAGLAPWNANKFTLTRKRKKIYVNNEPLIFYHYHGLRILNNSFAFPNLHSYSVQSSSVLKKVYYTYLLKLKAALNNIADNKIERYNSIHRKPLLDSLLETDGFFFFNKFFIYHLNVRPFYLKFLKLSNKLHGRVNKFKNLY